MPQFLNPGHSSYPPLYLIPLEMPSFFEHGPVLMQTQACLPSSNVLLCLHGASPQVEAGKRESFRQFVLADLLYSGMGPRIKQKQLRKVNPVYN